MEYFLEKLILYTWLALVTDILFQHITDLLHDAQNQEQSAKK